MRGWVRVNAPWWFLPFLVAANLAGVALAHLLWYCAIPAVRRWKSRRWIRRYFNQPLGSVRLVEQDETGIRVGGGNLTREGAELLKRNWMRDYGRNAR